MNNGFENNRWKIKSGEMTLIFLLYCKMNVSTLERIIIHDVNRLSTVKRSNTF